MKATGDVAPPASSLTEDLPESWPEEASGAPNARTVKRNLETAVRIACFMGQSLLSEVGGPAGGSPAASPRSNVSIAFSPPLDEVPGKIRREAGNSQLHSPNRRKRQADSQAQPTVG